ncbi:hypothetical protein DFP73DRAFT_531247 [Morchella snyderi]|nr:hypothetical protein DFP73DRAFT_531247 [Morchella snyderi]
MKNSISNAFLCALALLCVVVCAQNNGPCAQCPLIGNDQLLVACSRHWRDIVHRCSSTPECERFNIDGDLIDACTNTPLPLPSGTGSSTVTEIFASPSVASVTTTSTTSPSTTTSTSTTTSASGATGTSSGGSTTRTTTNPETSSLTVTTRSSTSTTTAPAGTFSQQVSGMAVGNAPGWWVEGIVLVAGWIFAL